MSKIDYWYSISNKANSTIAQSSNVESTTSALSTTSSLVSEFAEGMQNHSEQLYEKRLIIKYIDETGKEPVTNEDLSEEDLLGVKTKSFTLKRKYQEAQQELSHALFQYDAASNIKSHIEIQPPADTSTSETQKMQVDEEKGIGSSIIEKLVEASVVLSKGCKKRKPPPSLTPADTIKTFTQISTIPALHNSSTSGILCMDLDQTEKLVLTGGIDKKALIYDLEEGKVVSPLKGHTKKITNVLWREKAEASESDIVFTACTDKSVRIWNNTKKGYKTSSAISIHNAEITVSEDLTWGFHDIATAQTLVKIENRYSCVKFHPDGLILGTGTNDSVVRIWDIKAQQNVTTMEGHTGKVKSLSFSENGFYLATSSEDNLIKIWDLRKQTNVHTLTLENTKINKVIWDYSGQYIAVCGSDIRIFGTTEAETITEPEVQE
ncbi:7353_t:CDS:2 [Entrophospora sp. SA101]|nr:7353_t:CDS:2 [Entrophospora sp. SA101]